MPNPSVLSLHREYFGAPPRAVASAPATWAVLGEHTEDYGGTTVVAPLDARASVAASPTTTGEVRVLLRSPEGTVEDRALAPDIEKRGRAATDAQAPTAEDSPALWLGGVLWTMAHRQVLHRDITGMTVAVATDIPRDCGLGALSAIESALALALASGDPLADDPATRARLCEACTHAARKFSGRTPQRSRHLAALRGTGKLSVITHSTAAVMDAPALLGEEQSVLALAGNRPKDADRDSYAAEFSRRRKFLRQAARAFGVEFLAQLPDATRRVLDWLDAVHQVRGTEGVPTLAEAERWMNFWSRDTTRATELAATLRSRHPRRAAEAIRHSQSDLSLLSGLDAADDLIAALDGLGAGCARAATGPRPAVLAVVEKRKAEELAHIFGQRGVHSTTMGAGDPAETGANEPADKPDSVG